MRRKIVNNSPSGVMAKNGYQVKFHLFAANMFGHWKNSTLGLAQEMAVIHCCVLDLKTKGQRIKL